MDQSPPNLIDHDLLIRIDTKLDSVIKQGGDHEDRIKKLEAKESAASGALSAGRIIWGALAVLFVVCPNFINIFLQSR